MLGLLRRYRRRRSLRRPVPAGWHDLVEAELPFWSSLDDDERSRFWDELRVFVWGKHWIPAGGLEEVTEAMRVVIAATAVRLILHLDGDPYASLTEIVVYPQAALVDPSRQGGAEFAPGTWDGPFLGQAHTWGTVVLSWPAVEAGLADPHDGHDTATHEFAHVLDRANAGFNGTPRLRARADYGEWARVLDRHFQGLRRGGDAERHVLRRYGATNEAEFFAVATEAFFERGVRMREETPELYAVLSRYYGFDPAARRDGPFRAEETDR
jgi:Mlc titration factor MtfA (ptsG expression regulator)